DVTVITTETGQLFLRREGIYCTIVLLREPLFFQSLIRTKLGVSLVYLFRVVRSVFTKGIFRLKGFDAISATSHYFPDEFILFLLKFISSSKVYIVHLYHVFPLPSIASKYQSRTVAETNWIQQIMGFRLIRGCFILTFESQKHTLKSYGFDSARIQTIGMGLNLDEIDASAPLEKKFNAIFLGRLTRKKGVFDLLQAWKEVVGRMPSVTLCIAGQKSAEPVEEFIKNLGVERSVTLYGIVNGQQKYGLLKSADVFVFPSYEEGWGVVISEALSCGLPAVVYDLPAYKLFGNAVIRVPVGNVRMLADEVSSLLSNREKREAMRKIALMMSTDLGWKDEAQRELRLIEKFISAS
ncbi:MAG: glycosyltransferase family 4 protein, partial [Thaumarchaeota archaeon]|nr:glycosyltransferase family 4 protein [Nitrososphaerota archaeon]